MSFQKSLNKRIKLTSLLIIVAVIWVFIMPIIRLVHLSIQADNGLSLDAYWALFSLPRTQTAIINTLIISGTTTILASVIAGVLAFIVAYTNIRFKKIIELLILSPLILPSYVLTLAITNLFLPSGVINQIFQSVGLPILNMYSMGGIIGLSTITVIPLVYINTIRRLRMIPIELEWASFTSGYTRLKTIFKVNIPQVLPAWIAGGILAFLATIDNFSIPAFLGIPAHIPVLSTFIYEQAIGYGPQAFRSAAGLSVILSAIVLIFLLFERMAKREIGVMNNIKEDMTPRIILREKYRVILGGGILSMYVLLIVVPFILMMITSLMKFYGQIDFNALTWEHYQFVVTNPGVKKALINSFNLSLVATIITLIVAVLFSYVKTRKPTWLLNTMEGIISLNYALPGIVLALAMIFHWTKIPNVYGTYRILLIAYVTRYMILQIKGANVAFLSVNETLEMASKTSGASQIKTWWRIIIPMIAPQVISVSMSVFVAALTELTLSSLLSAAGSKTIGLTVFGLQQGGEYNLSYALSTVIVLVILIAYGLLKLLTKKKKGVIGHVGN